VHVTAITVTMFLYEKHCAPPPQINGWMCQQMSSVLPTSFHPYLAFWLHGLQAHIAGLSL
jgi:hypothetical protein